jgi:hypothetical protein
MLRNANICSRLTTASFHVMSFGIKYLCAVAIKSPPKPQKNVNKCLPQLVSTFQAGLPQRRLTGQSPSRRLNRSISARFPAWAQVVFGGPPITPLSHRERPNARRTRSGCGHCLERAVPRRSKTPSNEKRNDGAAALRDPSNLSDWPV